MKAAYAALTPEQRFVLVSNRDARVQYGIPDQQIVLGDLPSRADGCAYCGGLATEWDHVVPLARGGANAGENLVPACRTCNRSKNALSLDEWLSGGLYRSGK